MTKEELLALPAVIDVATAAEVLGIGRSSAYALVRAGEWPTPTLRLGRLIKIPVSPLLDLVGLAASPEEGTVREARSSSATPHTAMPTRR